MIVPVEVDRDARGYWTQPAELLPDHATADVVAARPEAGVLRDEYA